MRKQRGCHPSRGGAVGGLFDFPPPSLFHRRFPPSLSQTDIHVHTHCGSIPTLTFHLAGSGWCAVAH
eukprot:347634-Chlamydomonas_euryale.AAC.1